MVFVVIFGWQDAWVGAGEAAKDWSQCNTEILLGLWDLILW